MAGTGVIFATPTEAVQSRYWGLSASFTISYDSEGRPQLDVAQLPGTDHDICEHADATCTALAANEFLVRNSGNTAWINSLILAGDVQAGTFPAGNFTFPDNVTVDDVLVVGVDPESAQAGAVPFRIDGTAISGGTSGGQWAVSRTSAVTAGAFLGSFAYRGLDSAAGFGSGGFIFGIGRETWSGTVKGMYFSFNPVPAGQLGAEARFTIGELGHHVRIVGEDDAEMCTWDRTLHTNVSTLFHTGVRGITAGSEEYYEVRTGAFGSTTIRFSVRQDGRVATHRGGTAADTGFGLQSDPNSGFNFGVDSVSMLANALVRFQVNATGIGLFATTPVAQQTVTGSRGGNAALASLLTALANYGAVIDSST